MFMSLNPTTGETIAEIAAHTESELAARIDAAAAAFRTWREASFAERASMLRAVAERLRTGRDEHARLMTLEMGKPITQAESEVEKCAWVCEYYAENGEAFLAPEDIQTDAARSYVRFEPLGVVLAIMPWNFPFWQVFRCAAPALVAGNVVLLKHASNVPQCALALEKIFADANAPRGVFATLLTDSATAERLVRQPSIAGVSLTGSEGAGVAIGGAAGGALKRTVLELGGSDPFIVLEDADLDAAVSTAVTARLINNGQSCIAAKRFIAVDAIAAEFEERFATRLGEICVGDPLDPKTELGPLARADLVSTLHRQVTTSLGEGARRVVGGMQLPRPGFFYEQTLLADVRPGMSAFDEETFGPVAALIRARDADDAIALANKSRYGLGASLWTRDTRRGEELARHIEAGAVFVNGLVKSDPRLPFGGVKRSGYGRELARFGIREFVNVKSVWVA
jgi:succinate-semialdehyde dehydrogenase/glutarate-semialdehyde dehydrogenase